MTTIIIKRNGSKEKYNVDNIKKAIELAQVEIENTDNIETVINQIDAIIKEKEELHIYEVQAIVEQQLILNKLHDIATNYIQYRVKKDIARSHKSKLDENIEKLINEDKSIVNENANKNAKQFSTARDLTAGIVAKTIGLDMLPETVREAHLNGDIHYHDLDFHPYQPMTNCCIIDINTMFQDGFKMGTAEVEPPNSLETAIAQMVQIISAVSSSQYGGTTIDRIDEVLAPFAEINFKKHIDALKDHHIIGLLSEEDRKTIATERTIDDIKQAMQSLEYEINTLFTTSGQTPFISVGFGLGSSLFEREIQKAILNTRIKGMGEKGRTAIFPKLIFTLKDGLNLKSSDPNYDIKQLALKCSTKRMYPDIISYDKLTELTGNFKAPMGCRSFLQKWIDENGDEKNAGRMNLGVVTLNLPRIAIKSKDVNEFYKNLDEMSEIVKEALLYRIERILEVKKENAPILYQEGAFTYKDKEIEEFFKNRRATISFGYIGIYETTAKFFGPEWEHNDYAKEFSLNILKHLNKKLKDWSNTYNYHFSLYGTPSESLTDRFARLDLKKYGEIKDITDKGYYTNSFHYDVRKKPSIFEKLEFEKDYPKYASGGFIHYAEYPVLEHNQEALEAVWDFAYDKIGYLGTNTPIDKCFICGFQGEFQPTEDGFKCPECGNTDPKTCDVVKRTCGYLGNPQERPMIKGRHQEIISREKHMGGNNE